MSRRAGQGGRPRRRSVAAQKGTLMDPTENLRLQQSIALRIVNTSTAKGVAGYALGYELAELVLAYLDWRRAGGFEGHLPPAPAGDDA